MSYSQKPLLDIIKEGKLPGEGVPVKHIETVISNVFIFENTVYKIYKNDNEFFNKGFRDISTKEKRFDFTRRDFAWNNALSPSIYQKLVGLVFDNDIKITDPDDSSDELAFVMRRIDAADILFEKLRVGAISETDGGLMGQQLARSLSKVQSELPEKRSYYQIFFDRLNDLRDWIAEVPEYINPSEVKKYLDYLYSFLEQNKEWLEDLSSELTWDGDVHSHNSVYSDKTLYLMDTYPPKEDWHIGHKYLSVYRLGVDLWALSGNRTLFENFVKGYEQESGVKIDQRLHDFYIVYVASIMAPYLYMLQRTDSTKKEATLRFHEFLKEFFKNI